MADSKNIDIDELMDDINFDDIPTTNKESMTFEKGMEVFAEEEKPEDKQRLNYINSLKQTLNTNTGLEYVERYLKLKQVANAEKNTTLKKAILYATSDKAKDYIDNYKGSFDDVKSIIEEKDIQKKSELLADYLTKNKLQQQLEKVIVYYNKNDPTAIKQPATNSEALNKALNQTRKITNEAERINQQIEAYYSNGQKEKALKLAEEMGFSPERHKYTFTDKDLIDAYNNGFKARPVVSSGDKGTLNQYTISYQQNLAYKNLRDKFSGLDQFNNMAVRYIVAAEHLKEKGVKPNIYEVAKLSNPKTFDETFKDKTSLIENVRKSISEVEGKTVDEKTYLKLVSLFEENIANHMTVQFGYNFKDLKLKLPKVDQEMFLMREKFPKANFYQLETLSSTNSLDKQIRALTKNKFGYSTEVKYSDNNKSLYIEPNDKNKLEKPIVFIMSEEDIRQRDFYVSLAKEMGLEKDTPMYPLKDSLKNTKMYEEKSYMVEVDGYFYNVFKMDKGHNGDPEVAYYDEVFDEDLINEFKKSKEQKVDNEKILDGFKKKKPELEKPINVIDVAIEEISALDLPEEKKEPLIGNLDNIDKDHKQVSVYLKNLLVVNATLAEIDKRYTEEKKELLSKSKDFEEKILIEKALREKYYGFDEELVALYAKDKINKLEGKKSEFSENIYEYFTDKYLNDKESMAALKVAFPFVADIDKSINDKIIQNYDKTLSDPNEAMHNAAVAVFAKEFKLDEAKTKQLFSKDNLIKVAGTALKGTSLVINPVGFAVSQVVKGLIKTQPFQDFKDRLSNRVDNALNAVGITQGSATRKYLTIGAGIAAGAAIGAYLVISNDINMEDITALKNKIITFTETYKFEGLEEKIAQTSNQLEQPSGQGITELKPELTQPQADQLNKELIQSRPPVEQFTTDIENVVQPATSREIGEQLLKTISTPELESQISNAGYRMSDIELALNQNINEQMLQGKFPADTTIELIGKDNQAITIHMNADQLNQTKATLEAGMAKTQMITNGTIINEISNPDLVPVKEILPATPEDLAKILQGQTYSDIPLTETEKPEDVAKVLDSQPSATEVKPEEVVAQPVQLATVEVKAGDSLYEIAEKQLGANSTPEKINELVAAISAENNIKNPNLIYIGDKLTIPDIGNLQPVELKVAFNDPTDLYTNNLYLPPSGVDKLAEQMANVYVNDNISPENRELLVDKLKEVITYHSDGQPFANLSNSSFRYDVKEVVFELSKAQEALKDLELAMEEQVAPKLHHVRGIQI